MVLTFDVADVHGHTVVSPRGDLDLEGAPALNQQLQAAIRNGAHHLVVDLGDVDFLDSAGLGVLVGALKRIRFQGGKMSVVCSSEPILNIFRVTDLDKVFPIYSSVSGAVSSSPQKSS